MTRAFRCKLCGTPVECDNYPPSMRETYLRLEDAKLCETCWKHLKQVCPNCGEEEQDIDNPMIGMLPNLEDDILPRKIRKHCPKCGESLLQPIGDKNTCPHCKWVGDTFIVGV